MIKMRFIYICIFVFFNFFYTQKLSFIQYEVTGDYSNTIGVSPINEFLIFDNYKSFYFNTSIDNNEKKIEELISQYDINIGNVKILNYNQNEFVQVVTKPKSSKQLLCLDSYEKLDWEILKESKKILGYNCNLAKTKFRGREYFAYFTTELPFSYGPWKINGLPGIVLNVYEKEKIYEYTAVKVIINSEKLSFPDSILDFVDINKKEIIPYKDYIDMHNLFLKEMRDKQLASMGKGIVLTNVPDIRSMMREKSFEWEEIKKP